MGPAQQNISGYIGPQSRKPVCRLMVSALVIYAISQITTHLPTPKGWKAELAYLADP